MKRILRCEKNPNPERSDSIVSTPEGHNFHIGLEVWFGWFKMMKGKILGKTDQHPSPLDCVQMNPFVLHGLIWIHLEGPILYFLLGGEI